MLRYLAPWRRTNNRRPRIRTRVGSFSGRQPTFELLSQRRLLTATTEADGQADLIYDPATGNLTMDTEGVPSGYVVGYSLDSNGGFREENAAQPFGGVLFASDDNISLLSLDHATGVYHSGIFDLGDIAPIDLTLEGITEFLVVANYGVGGSTVPQYFNLVLAGDVNVNPTAKSDRADVGESSSVEIDVLANDLSPTGLPLTITDAFIANGQGEVSIRDNQLVYDPAGNYDWLWGDRQQHVRISYVASNGLASAANTVVVAVHAENGPLRPITEPDEASVAENTMVAIDVLANDDSPDGSALTVMDASVAEGRGRVSFQNNRIVYEAAGSYDGLRAGEREQVEIVYVVRNDAGMATGTVVVTVEGKNDAPSANDAPPFENMRTMEGTIDLEGQADLIYDPASGNLTLDTSRVASGHVVAYDLQSRDGFREENAKQPFGGILIANDRNIAMLGLDQHSGVYHSGSIDLGNIAPVGLTLEGISEFLTSAVYGVDGSIVPWQFGFQLDGDALQRPTAEADAASVSESATTVIDVLANDVSPDDSALTITGVSVAHGYGNVSVQDNRIVYDPAGSYDRLRAGQQEQVEIVYQIMNGVGTATGTVVVTLEGESDVPAEEDDKGENTPPVLPPFWPGGPRSDVEPPLDYIGLPVIVVGPGSPVHEPGFDFPGPHLPIVALPTAPVNAPVIELADLESEVPGPSDDEFVVHPQFVAIHRDVITDEPIDDEPYENELDEIFGAGITDFRNLKSTFDLTTVPAVNADLIWDVASVFRNFGKDDATRTDGDLDGDGLVQFSDFLIAAATFVDLDDSSAISQ